MHDQRGRMGWLVVLGLYWLVQVVYFLSPIDLVPDFIPVFGFVDDLVALSISFVVTGVSAFRAIADQQRAIGSHHAYEPLSPDELEAL